MTHRAYHQAKHDDARLLKLRRDGLTYGQIGARIGLTDNAVKHRIRKMRRAGATAGAAGNGRASA